MEASNFDNTIYADNFLSILQRSQFMDMSSENMTVGNPKTEAAIGNDLQASLLKLYSGNC